MTEGKMEDQEFDELDLANSFIRRKEYAKAEETLRLGLEKARGEKANEKMGFLLVALGQLYLLQKKQAEALDFFKQADGVSVDYYSKLNYARLLLTIYKDFDSAFNKATEALKLIPPKDQALNEAYSIMGLCCLSKNDQSKALEYFRDSLKVDFDQFAASESFDMTLIAALINGGLYDSAMDFYLATVRKKAVEEGNGRLIKVTAELIEKMKKR